MVFIIAEIGVNHNGDLSLARTLIEAAKEAGASAAKFQLYVPELLEPPGDRREMIRRLHLGRNEMWWLARYCGHVGIEFTCTPFDPGSAKFLIDELHLRTVKIGSADLNNRPLLDAVAPGSHSVILSTGMATKDEIEAALGRFWVPERVSSINGLGVSLLHCVSAYPTSAEDMNLMAMLEMMNEYVCFGVGLSDHSLSTVLPAVAVGMGASVIEKHLTLDRGMEGPDHKASLEPREFSEMVRNVREAESAIGRGGKRPLPCEAAVMNIAQERRAWRES